MYQLQKNKINIQRDDGISELHANKISDYFKDAVILITGATGFVGKILVEKFLRSCPEIKALYVLIRVKDDKNSEARFKEFVKEQVFDRLRRENPCAFLKLHLIPGNLTLPYLGLSDSDRQLLIQNVNFVISSAASVHLTAPLGINAPLNVLGTESVLEIAGKMLNLKCFTYISTAYCNPLVDCFEEKVYSLKNLPKEEILELIRRLSPEMLNRINEPIVGPYMNSYVLSKVISEQLVSECSEKFPICIVRPSIVTASLSEPTPGFVDNFQALNGFIAGAGQGPMFFIHGKSNVDLDLIPVDIVAKTIVKATRDTALNRSTKVQVYNCVSGNINPLPLTLFIKHLNTTMIQYPNKLNRAYPRLYLAQSKLWYVICVFLFYTLPALIVDFGLKMLGSKPKMLRRVEKIKKLTTATRWVTTRQWNFKTDNMEELMDSTKKYADGEDFCTNFRKLDWFYYNKLLVYGLRRYALLESDETLKAAKIKVWRSLFMELLFYVVLLLFIAKWFKWF